MIKERKRNETTGKKKVRTGRPPGSKSQNIPIHLQEEMFAVWSDNQNLKQVSRVCGVSVGTVRKYKEQNNWDARLGIILERLQGEVNEHLTEVKKELVLELVALRKKAKVEALQKGYKDAGQAANAFLGLMKRELDLRGMIQIEGVDLLALAAQKFQEHLQRAEQPKELQPGEFTVTDPDPETGPEIDSGKGPS